MALGQEQQEQWQEEWGNGDRSIVPIAVDDCVGVWDPWGANTIEFY
jgi:hypothetical protein